MLYKYGHVNNQAHINYAIHLLDSKIDPGSYKRDLHLLFKMLKTVMLEIMFAN